MTGRGKKPIQQAQIKTRTPIKLMSTQTLAAPTIIPEQPYIGNAAMFLEPQTSSVASNSQELRSALSPMSSIAIDDINLNQKSVEPEQDDSSNRFLASLIAQGAAGIGTGLMGGSASDIQRSANLFDRMRDFEVNRQDRLKQNELLRTEKLTEKQDKLSEIKKREDQAKRLIDPNSEESKRDRLLYEKVLKTKIPEEVSADDLRNRPEIVKSLMAQAEQSRFASMPKGGIGVGGAGKPKEEKESKDQSTANKYTAEADSLRNQLIKYKKAVKAIPRLGGAAQKATAEALQKDILLTIKNIKETGSLDAGSIGVIEGMIGTPDYTRDEIVDSTINTSLENLNAAVEAKLRGTGTKNTKYTPYIPYENPTPQEEEIIKNYYSDPNDPDNLKMYQTLRTKKGF